MASAMLTVMVQPENNEVSRGIPLQKLIGAMYAYVIQNRLKSAGLSASIFVLAVAYTVLRPQEYVASMLVTPVESSISDPTSLLTSSPLSIRSAFTLGNAPPPQMAAFIITLKSPELARRLADDPTIIAAIAERPPGFLGRFFEPSARAASPAQRKLQDIQAINIWLKTHITVDQDVDVAAWTIGVRNADANTALYILNRIHDDSESILREAAIRQFEKQHEYDMRLLKSPLASADQQTTYDVLQTVDRSLMVLRSGSNVATVVLSRAYVPPQPEYPPRILSFAIAFVPGIILLTILLAFFARRHLSEHKAETRRAEPFRPASGIARAPTA
jgi:hypothetical protein